MQIEIKYPIYIGIITYLAFIFYFPQKLLALENTASTEKPLPVFRTAGSLFAEK